MVIMDHINGITQNVIGQPVFLPSAGNPTPGIFPLAVFLILSGSF